MTLNSIVESREPSPGRSFRGEIKRVAVGTRSQSVLLLTAEGLLLSFQSPEPIRRKRADSPSFRPTCRPSESPRESLIRTVG